MMSAAGGGSGAAPAISPPAPRARQASKVEAPPPVWIKLRGAYIECEPFRVPISRRCRNIDDLRTVVQAAAPALRRFHQSRLEVYLHDGAERSTPLGLGDSIPASASECADKALNVELFVPTRVWVYLPTFPAPSTARQVHTDSCRTIGDFRTPIMKAFAAELGAFCESELRMRLSLEEGDEAENVLADLEFPLTHLPASVVMNSATPLCIRVVPVPGRCTGVECAMPFMTCVANRRLASCEHLPAIL
mmetsp:Transcript_31196/g.87071  ORF Transcript_31196/g.87071 Transcript_31196/m.87071 type:complete len:248 (-) Transcript_31196:378-1121(-)